MNSYVCWPVGNPQVIKKWTQDQLRIDLLCQHSKSLPPSPREITVCGIKQAPFPFTSQGGREKEERGRERKKERGTFGEPKILPASLLSPISPFPCPSFAQIQSAGSKSIRGNRRRRCVSHKLFLLIGLHFSLLLLCFEEKNCEYSCCCWVGLRHFLSRS